MQDIIFSMLYNLFIMPIFAILLNYIIFVLFNFREIPIFENGWLTCINNENELILYGLLVSSFW